MQKKFIISQALYSENYAGELFLNFFNRLIMKMMHQKMFKNVQLLKLLKRTATNKQTKWWQMMAKLNNL